MHTNFSDLQKAGIFTVVVLVLATAAALVIRVLGLASSFFVWAAVWSITPVLATVIMLLVVTRDGYSKEGWRTLGLHRLGLRVWWIAFFGTLAITVVAYAAVWLTPLASATVPPQGALPVVRAFLLQVPILATTFLLCEEIGFRGYLLPKLLPLGRKRGLLLSGLIFATWHVPLAFLTPLLPIGNPAIGLPLFYAAVVAGSFFYGYLRLASGSIWPASIAHATHNSVSGMIPVFSVTSAPLLVNTYLVGEFGILITAAAAILAALVSRLVPDDIKDHDRDSQAPVSDDADRTTTADRSLHGPH
jgi:membrane protease YdiL (CAAX protease family)